MDVLEFEIFYTNRRLVTVGKLQCHDCAFTFADACTRASKVQAFLLRHVDSDPVASHKYSKSIFGCHETPISRMRIRTNCELSSLFFRYYLTVLLFLPI